jgi:DNA-binding transcriptional ArsR family regulator
MAVGDRPDGATVRQIADRIREPQRRVRYHLSALQKQKLVAVAGERKRRGVVERRFRLMVPNLIPSADYEQLDAALARKIPLHVLKVILADASAAANAGLFNTRAGHATIRVYGALDQQGWNEVAALQEGTLAQCQSIIASAKTRLARSSEDPIHFVNAFLLFEAPDWASSDFDTA